MKIEKKFLKKLLQIALVITAAVLVLSGIFIQRLDKNVSQKTVPEVEPQRIVSLAPNITEILFELGIGNRVVAVSNDCDWPAEAKNREQVGSFWQPNVEAIIASKPDLVITLWFQQQSNVADTLRRLGYNVLTLKLEKLDELEPAIEKIGAATGHKAEAEKLIDRINSQINHVKQKYENQERPLVLWVVQPQPLRVAAGDTFITELLALAGAENTISSTRYQYPGLSREEILTCGADVIIQAAMYKDNIERQKQEAFAFWSEYQNLPAVQNGRIYIVESDTILRLGPRIGFGLEQMGQVIHEP
jgi:iron complex transport system substrate-binding protein